MYKVTNNRSRSTSIALPGAGITLPKRGDTAKILDGEYHEDTVQALIKAKIITAVRVSGHDSELARGETVAKERHRIKVTHQAHSRAALRARGIQPANLKPLDLKRKAGPSTVRSIPAESSKPAPVAESISVPEIETAVMEPSEPTPRFRKKKNSGKESR